MIHLIDTVKNLIPRTTRLAVYGVIFTAMAALVVIDSGGGDIHTWIDNGAKIAAAASALLAALNLTPNDTDHETARNDSDGE